MTNATIRLTILLLIGFFFIDPVNAQVPEFVLHKKVGSVIGMPADMAIDSKGYIYLADFQLLKTDPDGKFNLDTNIEGLNRNAFGSFRIAFDQQDNLYVVSYTYSKFAKFNKEGKLLFEMGSKGDGPGQFNYPEEIATNSKGEIYVVDNGNKRIQKFDPNGKYLLAIPIPASGDNSSFPSKYSLDFDAQDNLYLLDNPNKNIVKYSALDEKLIEFGQLGGIDQNLQNPANLAIDRKTDRIYVSDPQLNGFYVFKTSGEFEKKVQNTTGEAGISGTQQSIGVNPEGHILIADRRHHGNSQVIVFDKDGNVLKKIGYTYSVVDLAVDEGGNTFLLETSVKKFNLQGEEI